MIAFPSGRWLFGLSNQGMRWAPVLAETVDGTDYPTIPSAYEPNDAYGHLSAFLGFDIQLGKVTQWVGYKQGPNQAQKAVGFFQKAAGRFCWKMGADCFLNLNQNLSLLS